VIIRYKINVKQPHAKNLAGCNKDHHLTGLPAIFTVLPSIVASNPTQASKSSAAASLLSQTPKLDFSNPNSASSKKSPLKKKNRNRDR
jgi:hypothetical protein